MRVTRRAKLRRLGYAPWHEYQLLCGHVLLHPGYGEREDFDATAARADWDDDHRAELMAFWQQDPTTWTPDPDESHWHQAEPGGPGTRPWAWWAFDAPEPRRLVRQWGLVGSRGAERVVEVPITVDMTEWPRLWRTDRVHAFYLGQRTQVPGIVDFEREWAYLDRFGLLSPEARDRLAAEDDADPEPPDIHDPVFGWLTRRELESTEREHDR